MRLTAVAVLFALAAVAAAARREDTGYRGATDALASGGDHAEAHGHTEAHAEEPLTSAFADVDALAWAAKHGIAPVAPGSGPSEPHDSYGEARVSFLRRRSAEGGWSTEERDLTPSAERPAVSATLTAGPTPLCVGNGTVKVQWSGVQNPYSNDTIVLFSPANSSASDWLDYFPVSSANGWQSGAGSLSFTLLNMRTDYVFRYYSGANNVVLGASNVVGVCALPLQAHLSLTGDNTQMRLMFTTPHGNAQAVGVVEYGLSPDSMDLIAYGQWHTYAASDMCGAPANVTSARLYRDPGAFWDVLMTDLKPETRYFYRFGAPGAADFSSPTYSFRSAPAVGPLQPLKFVTYGDMGEGYLVPEAAATATRVNGEVPTTDFVLHIGDISYARSVGYSWEWFGSLIQNIATAIPYQLGVGNHEYDHVSGGEHDPSGAPGVGFHPAWGNFGDDSAGECGRPLYERFHMPDNGRGVFWWSMDYGSAHVIHMSTEHDWTPGSDQYQWLLQELQSVDRTQTPWLILAGHRPMYTSENFPSDYQVSLYMQAALEDITHQYGVDIALWGHYHAYERTCAVYNQTCRDDGTVHIVVGTAGFELDQTTWMGKVWSVNHAVDFGYGRVLIDADPNAGTTSLTYQFVFNANGTVYDEVTLTKPLPSAALNPQS